jgi:hypothetical protein
MNYANIITGKIVDTLPTVKITADGSVVQQATIADYLTDGWRIVTDVEKAVDGNRIIAYRPEAIDDKTCRLIATSVVNVAAEKLAQEQAQEMWDTQLKQADADFTTWSKHERFLLAMIAKIAPDLDLAKEYETFT